MRGAITRLLTKSTTLRQDRVVNADTLLTEVKASRALPSLSMRRAIRKDAKVSLARLAAALGVSVQAVSHWELGTRQPRPANAVAYAAILRALQDARNETDDAN
jgi:DNA-binding transcriptional regulator YiaG